MLSETFPQDIEFWQPHKKVFSVLYEALRRGFEKIHFTKFAHFAHKVKLPKLTHEKSYFQILKCLE
jgi:hypothetical protein